MIVRQFVPADLMLLALQPHQRALKSEVCTPAYGAELAKHGDSFTVYDGHDVIAIVGLIRQWEGCERAYAFLSQMGYANMRDLVDKIAAYLETSSTRRIEAAVQNNFRSGHKFVKRLGFKEEGLMEKYWKDEDAMLYARVR